MTFKRAPFDSRTLSRNVLFKFELIHNMQVGESETYLNHLRSQLADLKTARAKYEEAEDEINELEQNYAMLRQERAENEALLEESLKTHMKILEGVKAETNFMMKNLMDKQLLHESSFQLVNAKRQELGQVSSEVATAEAKLESLAKGCVQVDERTAVARSRIAQVAAEKMQNQQQVSELKENLRVLNEQLTETKMTCIEREKECLLAEKRKENQAAVLEDRRQELKRLQAKQEACRSEIDTIKDQMESKTRQIKEVKQTTSQLAHEFKELSGKLAEEAETNREIEGLLNRKN